MSHNVIPTSPADQKAIKSAIKEASDAMTRVAAEKDLIKDIRNDIKDKFKITPKRFNQMLSAYHNQNFGKVTAEQEEFEDMYTSIFGQSSGSNVDIDF